MPVPGFMKSFILLAANLISSFTLHPIIISTSGASFKSSSSDGGEGNKRLSSGKWDKFSLRYDFN